MSKKNYPRSSKVEKKEKENEKKRKIIKLDSDNEEDFSDSLEEINLEEEVEKKNKVERLIKGEKQSNALQVNKEQIDKTVTININDQVKDEPDKTVSIVKKTRKETIIDSIIDAFKQLDITGEEAMTYAQLKATKINILEKKLADLTEKIVIKVGSPDVKQISEISSPISNDLATGALFNINIIMARFLENMAETARQNEATRKYVPNINGFTNKLLQPEKEKQLKECLKSIIELHGDKIKPYMSPICIWAMFMITSASEQITENLSKNLDQPITQ